MSKYTKRICFFVCAVFSFYLFKISFDYFIIEQALHKTIKNKLLETPIEEGNNYGFYKAKLQQINYQTNIIKANQSVWSSDKKRYLSNAEKALRKYLNYYPADGEYWLKLLSVQHMIHGVSDSLNWTIAQNLKWNQWNKKYMLNIAFHCVQNWQLLPVELQNECISSMSKLSGDQYYKNRLIGTVRNLKSWSIVSLRLNN